MPRGVRAGLAALAVLVVAAAPALGQEGGVDVTDPIARSQALQRQLGQYRQKYAEVSDDAVALLADLDVAKRAKSAADDALALLDTQVADATTRLTEATARRDTAEKVAAAAAQHVADARARADAANKALSARALDAYIGQGRMGVLTDLLTPASGDEAAVAAEYAVLAGKVQAGRLAEARVARREADQAAADAETARAAAVSAEADAAAQQAALQQERESQAQAQQQAASELTQVQQLLATIQSQKASYQLQMDQLSSDSASIAQMLRARSPGAVSATSSSAAPATSTAPKPAPSHAPTASSAAKVAASSVAPATTTKAAPPAATKAPATTAPAGPSSTFPQNYSTGDPPNRGVSLTYPMPGYPIVSVFGMRQDPVLNVYRMHEGIDIYAPEGTPIHAAGGGTIIWAGARNGYGNAVFIDHGRGVVTVYAHQSRVGVSVGQHVGPGDVIGYIGHTGLAAGPHLHFETRVDGTAYNPLKFVSPR